MPLSFWPQGGHGLCRSPAEMARAHAEGALSRHVSLGRGRGQRLALFREK